MSASAQTIESPSGVAPQPPTRILVADDEHLVAVSLAESLRQHGFEVIGPAADGQQAIALARQNKVDMALLDIRMPVLDGLSAAKVLFEEMGIPVVLVTAYSDTNFLKTAADIGIFGYMIKPVTGDDLRATLTVTWSRYLQHRKLSQEVKDLKTALEERKLIERAKGILMDTQNLSEAEAMKRLQKQARDARRRLADTAKAIIDAHDKSQP